MRRGEHQDAPVRPLPGVSHSRLLVVAPVGRVQLEVDEALEECCGASSSVCVLRRRDGRPGEVRLHTCALPARGTRVEAEASQGALQWA